MEALYLKINHFNFILKWYCINIDCVTGVENSIVCGRDGELHHLWTAAYQCMVCVCAMERGHLRPACARCAGCRSPDPLHPEPTQTVSPLIADTQSTAEPPGYLSEFESYANQNQPTPLKLSYTYLGRIRNVFFICSHKVLATYQAKRKNNKPPIWHKSAKQVFAIKNQQVFVL